jgi:hypothetical protein
MIQGRSSPGKWSGIVFFCYFFLILGNELSGIRFGQGEPWILPYLRDPKHPTQPIQGKLRQKPIDLVVSFFTHGRSPLPSTAILKYSPILIFW